MTHEHGHAHGRIAPDLLKSAEGIRALKWSLAGLLLTAGFQVVVVTLSGSIALLADTIHNFSDALTAVPLWVAFRLSCRPPSRRFTYGFGRFEDLAGLIILLMILLSALVAGYEAVYRLLHPQPITQLAAVGAAALVGFAGNELVAQFRLKTGRRINSAALIADGYHARVDGLTSLAVFLGAIGVYLGYPVVDPIVGLLISLMIVAIVWQSGRDVLLRLLDGVEPHVIEEITRFVGGRQFAGRVTAVKARWSGHCLGAEIDVEVESGLSVADAHAAADDIEQQLRDQFDFLHQVTVHIDPAQISS